MEMDLIGHAWAVAMLRRHINAGYLRHAYLFTGPRGIGKRSFALQFSMAINCTETKQPGIPCGSCRNCLQIQRMQHPDLCVVQAEAEGNVLKVDQIREMQHQLSLAPYQSAYRIGLILRMEEANESAQNALLKTLEEPNEKVILLLTADQAENLLPTIPSRCESIALRPVPLDELALALTQKEKQEPEKARLIAHISGGRPGYALQLLHEPERLEKRKLWLEDLSSLLKSNRRERFAYCEKNFDPRKKERGEIKETLAAAMTCWLTYWRDVMVAASAAQIPLINLDLNAEIFQLAHSIDLANARHLTCRIENSLPRLANANLRLLAESLILEWPHIP
jgi:DNA polymerase III subunit delta'